MKKFLLFVLIISGLTACTSPMSPYDPNYHPRNNRTHADDDSLIIPDDTTDYASVVYIGKLRTFTSNDWDYWELYLLDSINGTFRTFTSEDWDYWEFNYDTLSGNIRTFTSNDWDYWEVNSPNYYKIRTYTSEDWDYWEIYNDDKYFIARTFTSEDWDYWEIYNDSVYYKLRTFTSEDWDYWEIFADTNYVELPDIAPVCFIAIFTSSIYQQGIVWEK